MPEHTMKIVIVGAGISGLACYLFLQKHLSAITPNSIKWEIIVLESHASTKRDEPAGAVDYQSAANSIGASVGIGTDALLHSG